MQCTERGGGIRDEESDVVFELQQLGYRLMGKSKTDTYLVLESQAVKDFTPAMDGNAVLLKLRESEQPSLFE